jgi:hypothetical protein
MFNLDLGSRYSGCRFLEPCLFPSTVFVPVSSETQIGNLIILPTSHNFNTGRPFPYPLVSTLCGRHSVKGVNSEVKLDRLSGMLHERPTRHGEVDIHAFILTIKSEVNILEYLV